MAVPMVKVHLAAVAPTDLLDLLCQHAAHSVRHEVVADPESADLILLLGNFALEPQRVLEHALYKAFPDKCAVYNEEDDYLPLLPGLYCSACADRHTRCGRVFSYAYVSRNGPHRNQFLDETAAPAHEAAEKRYLFSFLGGSTSLVRKRLFNLRFGREDVLIENTSSYFHWDNSQPGRLEQQRYYAETLAASHFALCPRGAGRGTIRFFEAMAAGVAPVLISDALALPPGPAWDEFLLRVRERDIARLPAILEPLLPTAAERGRRARGAFAEYFSIEKEFDRIAGLAALALRHQPPPEWRFRQRQAVMIRRAAWLRNARRALRAMALATLKRLALKNPYQMNRPEE